MLRNYCNIKLVNYKSRLINYNIKFKIMKAEDFMKAIETLSKSHSVEMIINYVKPNGQVSPVLESPTISIIGCPARVVHQLRDEGYSISMNDRMMIVDKY